MPAGEEEEEEEAEEEEGQERSWTQKTGKIITKDKSTQIRELSEKWLP